MSIGIYCFINKLNNKKYIGQSIHIEHRYNEHKTRHLNKTSSMYHSAFYQALRKYGFDNFDFIILDSNDNYTKEDLNKLEIYYIKKYNTYYNGYNMNYGGNSIYVSHKLTQEKVLQLKQDIINNKLTFIDIAKKYNVESSLISQINQGIIWKEIGNYSYPLRINTYINNSGGSNPNAKLSNQDVLTMRKRYVNENLNQIYKDYKDKVSFSTVKKILYGSQFKSLPVYKKRQKAWYLNGTCIDYPRLEE